MWRVACPYPQYDTIDFNFQLTFRKTLISQMRENVRFLKRVGKLARFVTLSQGVVEARGVLLEFTEIVNWVTSVAHLVEWTCLSWQRLGAVEWEDPQPGSVAEWGSQARMRASGCRARQSETWGMWQRAVHTALQQSFGTTTPSQRKYIGKSYGCVCFQTTPPSSSINFLILHCFVHFSALFMRMQCFLIN